MVSVLNAAGPLSTNSEVRTYTNMKPLFTFFDYSFHAFMRSCVLAFLRSCVRAFVYLIQVVIATPSIHLAAAKSMFRPEIATCAEDVSFAKGYGAFTGELSAEMLVDSGISWTLTGHSERRVGFGFPGETSTVVGIKTKNAIDCGMSVMACIGEQLADREAGIAISYMPSHA